MKKVLLIITVCLLLVSCKSNYEIKFEDGLKYMQEGKYDKALFIFEELIEIDPNNFDVYQAMAECYDNLGNEEEYNIIISTIKEKFPDESVQTTVQEDNVSNYPNPNFISIEELDSYFDSMSNYPWQVEGSALIDNSIEVNGQIYSFAIDEYNQKSINKLDINSDDPIIQLTYGKILGTGNSQRKSFVIDLNKGYHFTFWLDFLSEDSDERYRILVSKHDLQSRDPLGSVEFYFDEEGNLLYDWDFMYSKFDYDFLDDSEWDLIVNSLDEMLSFVNLSSNNIGDLEAIKWYIFEYKDNYK